MVINEYTEITELLEMLDDVFCIGEIQCYSEMVDRIIMASGIIDLIHDREILADMVMM